MSKNLKTHNHTFKEKRKCIKAYKKFGCVLVTIGDLAFVAVMFCLIIKNK